MVRIIPWNLPPVNGGSIGGYTPDSGDSDPEPVVQYYDFSNVSLGTGAFQLAVPNTVFNSYATKTLTPTAVNSGSFTGIVTNTVLGVANIKVAINYQYTGVNSDVAESTDLVLSLDPVSFAPTYSAGTVTYTNGGNQSLVSSVYVNNSSGTLDSMTLKFYVVNGNGEVIQESEEITIA